MLSSNQSTYYIDTERFITNAQIERIRQKVNVVIEAIVVIANRYDEGSGLEGQINLEEKYGTKIYSVISHGNICRFCDKY